MYGRVFVWVLRLYLRPLVQQPRYSTLTTLQRINSIRSSWPIIKSIMYELSTWKRWWQSLLDTQCYTLATTYDKSVGALCRANDGFIVAQEGRNRPAQVENKKKTGNSLVWIYFGEWVMIFCLLFLLWIATPTCTTLYIYSECVTGQ